MKSQSPLTECKLRAGAFVPTEDRTSEKGQMTTAAAGEAEFRVADSKLMRRVFYAFAALALFSAGISLAGKWFGHSIAMAGYTDDTSLREVVIGNNVLTVPANYIRFDRARHDGIAARLDLYMRYPQMDGYSQESRDDFNNVGDGRKLVFMSFEPKMMSRDMSGRFAPIYSSLVAQPGKPGPGGLVIYGFTEKSGYLNETLAVAERAGKDPFVARCLSGASAAESLAPCERDVLVGDDLSLSYRFPEQYLGDWEALDAAMMATASRFLKTGR